jgi:hypothetical protein
MVKALLDSMKSQPLAIALVTVNLVFLWVYNEHAERRDQLIAQMVSSCLGKESK